MEGGWFDEEAIEQERFDADLLQAQYEREGNEFWRQLQRAKKLREEGKLQEAAEACPHSGGYPLDSLAAGYNEDPHKGENGFRCVDCGSRVTDIMGDVLVACEIPPTGFNSE
jgi:hypothetical protein